MITAFTFASVALDVDKKRGLIANEKVSTIIELIAYLVSLNIPITTRTPADYLSSRSRAVKVSKNLID